MSLPSLESVARFEDVQSLRDTYFELSRLYQRERELRESGDREKEAMKRQLDMLGMVGAGKATDIGIVGGGYVEGRAVADLVERHRTKSKERLAQMRTEMVNIEESHIRECQRMRVEIDAKTKLANDLAEENGKLKVAVNGRISDIQRQLGALTNVVRSGDEEKRQQVKRIADLSVALHDREMENTIMVQKIAGLQKKTCVSTDLKRLNVVLSDTVEELKAEVFTLRQQQSENGCYEAAIADRESTIVKLKAKIHDMLRIEAEKSAEVHRLQEEICQLTRRIGHLSSDREIDRTGVDETEAPKVTIDELTRKNKRLSDVIARSNSLYAQLKEENMSLRAPKVRDLTFVWQGVFEHDGSKRTHNTKRDHKVSESAYLRYMLMQFFMGEEKNRNGLISVILNLAGCDSEQVHAAEARWTKSSMISGFLGF